MQNAILLEMNARSFSFSLPSVHRDALREREKAAPTLLPASGEGFRTRGKPRSDRAPHRQDVREECRKTTRKTISKTVKRRNVEHILQDEGGVTSPATGGGILTAYNILCLQTFPF